MADLKQSPSVLSNSQQSQEELHPLSSYLPIVPEDEGEEEENGGGEGNEDEGHKGSVEEMAVAISDHDNDDEDVTSQQQGTGYCSSVQMLKSSAFLIYCSQFLSAWGDRMWTFAVALYLVEIEDHSLRLTAVFGFALTISVLLFGTLVGQWVDRTPRLSAARRSLVIQNICVIVCAVCLLLLLHYKAEVNKVGDGALFFFFVMIIILIGVIANLASVAEKICIQKDWVVILAGNNKERLAEMNASVRRIDLTVNILAPILVGQIMTFASMTIAGVFIASWNLVSLVAEYYLLLRVYKKVPRLATKLCKEEVENPTVAETRALSGHVDTFLTEDIPQNASIKEGMEDTIEESQRDACLNTDEDKGDDDDDVIETAEGEGESSLTDPVDRRMSFNEKIAPAVTSSHEDHFSAPSRTPKLLQRMANWFLSIYNGWLTYKSYPVYLAGLALAFLYMTVMGFDSITNGYGYAMGLSESMLGIIRAFGSIAGIMGTFAFPRMRQRIGVTRTGLYSLSEEIMCLTLCLVSIWAPGSPFNPNYFAEQAKLLPVIPSSISLTSSAIPGTLVSGAYLFNGALSDVTPANTKQELFARLYKRAIDNGTESLESGTMEITTDSTPQDMQEVEDDVAGPFTTFASPILFFLGMITSRIGLWMFDLVTTQLIQENVRENERGVFNGTQRSLECSMDMLHFILVIILPSAETFGYLIILSFIFISVGAILYCVFSFRDRGHLFHPEKVIMCMTPNYNSAHHQHGMRRSQLDNENQEV